MKVNLIPPEDRHYARRVRREPLLATLALAVAGVLAGLTVFEYQQVGLAARRVDSLKAALARLEPYRKELAELRKQTEDLEKAVKELEQRAASQGAGGDVAWLLEHAAASAFRAGTVWLQRLTFTGDRLQLEGQADSGRAVSLFLWNLTRHPRLAAAQGGVELMEGDEPGRVRLVADFFVTEVGTGGAPQPRPSR